MKLLLKFNLILLVVFVLGLVTSSMVARNLLQKAEIEQAAGHARLLIEQANAVGMYTATQIKPLLDKQIKEVFLPQSVPAYGAAEVLNILSVSHPEYSFKSAMLNPTNPLDKAVEWEEDVINEFKTSPQMKEVIGKRSTPGGEMLYVATPIRITDPACLSCHTTPAAAPPKMVERYGASNGFGWRLNETLGAQVVSLPLSVPLQRADEALVVVNSVLAAVFLLMGVILNLMLLKLVIQPVSRLSEIADKVSMGEEAPEFNIQNKDEIGILSDSFGRMRKSLTHAMKLLED